MVDNIHHHHGCWNITNRGTNEPSKPRNLEKEEAELVELMRKRGNPFRFTLLACRIVCTVHTRERNTEREGIRFEVSGSTQGQQHPPTPLRNPKIWESNSLVGVSFFCWLINRLSLICSSSFFSLVNDNNRPSPVELSSWRRKEDGPAWNKCVIFLLL